MYVVFTYNFRYRRRESGAVQLVSHELRSPLQAPLRYIGNLLSGLYGPLSDTQRHRIQRIAQGIGTETRLVNNLLDLSYLEAGRFTFRPVPFSLRDVVQEVVNSLEVKATDINVGLLWMPPENPFSIPIDPDHIKQAIGNLLCNALEHTPAGKNVEVYIDCYDDTVRCKIRDEGIGIAPPHLERIFERGYRVPAAAKYNRGGLGIGLHIARGIVRAHGGDIVAESRLGEGSLFTIILPASHVHPEDTNNAGTNNGSDR